VASWNDDQGHRNLAFLRNWNDWEEEGGLALLALLANAKVAFDGDKSFGCMTLVGNSPSKVIVKRCIKGPINFIFQHMEFGRRLPPKLVF